MHALAALALSRDPPISKALGVALAEAVATNKFDEEGEGFRPAGTFSWPYVPKDDTGDRPAVWATLKVRLARAGWGYIGHGEYGGETGGVAPEDCEDGQGYGSY